MFDGPVPLHYLYLSTCVLLPVSENQKSALKIEEIRGAVRAHEMSKRNAVTFNRPSEPAFLKRIKEQVGYKEGPTVDTKRQQESGAVSAADLQDTPDEKPTVVVLKPGDLTAEEAEDFQQRQLRDEEEKPADLNAPIVFKSRKAKNFSSEDDRADRSEPARKKQKTKKVSKKALLSFDDDYHGEEAD